MQILDITISRHRLPLDPPFLAAWDGQPRTTFTATIVRARAEGGLEGIGSGDDMLGFEQFKHLFVGKEAGDLARHAAVLDNLQFHYARYWPLDIALWDLAAKAQGVPLRRLLRGARDRLQLYASLGSRRGEAETVRQAAAMVAEGFGALKLRFHAADWREDVAVLAAVRRQVGPTIAIMVDANQGWRMPWDTAPPWSLAQAREVAAACAAHGVQWLEEPLHRGDIKGMTRLRAESGIAIAGGEMTRELHELRQLVDRGCVDVLQADVALTGGMTGLRAIARRCRTAGIIFSPHTWSNGIGLMANAQLASAFRPPYLEFPYDPPAWTPARRDFMLTGPIGHCEGWLELPEGPGLGIELDEDRLAATRIDA